MLKYTILLLIFISYANVAGYNIWIDPYDLSSNKWVTCEYSNSQYDYYVLGGSLHEETHINVKFTPLTHVMDTYYVTTKIVLDSTNINLFINNFYSMILNAPIGTTQSISYTTKSDYPYMYFSFHAYSSGTVQFDFKTYLTSTLAAYIIVLIVIGVLVCLALASMGIAKAMGRNAWEGLACFCILCTLCFCRR